MQTFSDVISSLFSDFIQARNNADKYTKDTFMNYQKDSFLKLMPVPRIAMKEVTLNLKLGVVKDKSLSISIQKRFREKLINKLRLDIYKSEKNPVVNKEIEDQVETLYLSNTIYNINQSLSIFHLSDDFNQYLLKTILSIGERSELLKNNLPIKELSERTQLAMPDLVKDIRSAIEGLLLSDEYNNSYITMNTEELEGIDKSLLQEVSLTFQLEDVHTLNNDIDTKGEKK